MKEIQTDFLKDVKRKLEITRKLSIKKKSWPNFEMNRHRNHDTIERERTMQLCILKKKF